MTTLAARIREARLAAGIQEPADLARRIGVRPASAYYWEDGSTKSLKGETLIALSSELGVSPRWLMTGKGQMIPATASQFVTLDPTILTAAFRFLRNVIEGQGMPFEADSDPESVALAYEWFAAQPDAQHPTNVIQLGRKLAELKKAREVRRESGRDSETGDRAK